MTATAPTQTNKTLRNLLSLERYWFYAEKIKLLFLKEMQVANLGKLNQSDQAELLIKDHIVYMSYWLGGLYVVIEGYKELSISDEKIDQLLLDDDRKDTLRLFRNGTFHYQQDYFTPKLLDFFANSDSLNWARSLHERLGPVLRAQITAAQAAPDAKNGSPGG